MDGIDFVLSIACANLVMGEWTPVAESQDQFYELIYNYITSSAFNTI